MVTFLLLQLQFQQTMISSFHSIHFDNSYRRRSVNITGDQTWLKQQFVFIPPMHCVQVQEWAKGENVKIQEIRMTDQARERANRPEQR